MTLLTKESTPTENDPGLDVPVSASLPPNQATGDETPNVSYCTSEQMDLLRQVFAEVDRRPRRNSTFTTFNQERMY
jgi:hypothetical protein